MKHSCCVFRKIRWTGGIKVWFINFSLLFPALPQISFALWRRLFTCSCTVYRRDHQSTLKESRRTSNPLSHGVGSELSELCRVNQPVKAALWGTEVAKVQVRVPGVPQECARPGQGVFPTLPTILEANSVGIDNQFSTASQWDSFNAASFVCGWSWNWDKEGYTGACWWDYYGSISRIILTLKKKIKNLNVHVLLWT